MSARNQRLRARAGMLRDIVEWYKIAVGGVMASISEREREAWDGIAQRCAHYECHVRNPHIAPATPRNPLQTILVPLYVWRKVSRQADAFARARRKRTEQIKRRNAL